MNAQLAIELMQAGLKVRYITEKDNGNYIVECAPVDWRQAYTDRLKRAGWDVIRFGQTIEYAGHVGRIAQTEIEIAKAAL